MTATKRHDRFPVAWGSWNGVEGAARSKRRRRGESLRRLESLEDRLLLAASIAVDGALVLQYDGDAGASELVTVSSSGSTIQFSSNNDILFGAPPVGVTITYPNPLDLKVVDVTGITAMNVVMHTGGSWADVQTGLVPANVYDTVPEANYTFNQPGAAGLANGLLLSDGDNSALTGFFQTLKFSSQSATFQFADLHVANKTNLVVNQNATPGPYDVTVSYGVSLLDGVTLVTINQSVGDDSASLVDLPLGVNWSLNQGLGNDVASLSIFETGGTDTRLDGGPGIDTLLIDGDNLAMSAANFFVNPDGSVSIRDVIAGGGEVNYRNYESVVVSNVAATTTVVTTRPIDAVQGVRLVDALIGTFTASTTTAKPGDFGATIAWGDTSSSAGTIVQDASNPSVFYVYGTHTYTGATSPLTTQLTVRTRPATTTIFVGSSPVTFNAPASVAGPVDGVATITGTTAAALVPTVFGVPIHGVEGQRLNNVLVGAFRSSTDALAADFVATVAWGDGKTSTGTIVQDASNPSIYYIYGSHTYYAPGQGMPTSITVKGLATTFQQLVNGSPVTFFRPAGAAVTQASSAYINDAPIDVTVNAVNGFENIPTASGASVILTPSTELGGIDPTLADPAATYTATVYWGDGTSGVGVVSIQRLATSSRFVVRAAPHTYAIPRAYPITVVVGQAGEPTLGIGTNFAKIADAPLNATFPQPAIADATETVRIVDAVIGSFTDANPLATPSQFKVTVDWGDGSGTQLARVIQPGGVGTTFLVVGSHTYANSIPTGGAPSVWGSGPFAALSPIGNYAIKMAVQDTYGSAVNLANTIRVLDRTLSVAGTLDSASDTGVSNTDGITKDNTPSFTGWTSEGNAIVVIFASKDGGSPVAIGTTTSDASGAWSFTPDQALLDGGYVILAQARDAGGHSISNLTELSPNLVIDTVGPKITDVLFDNLRGQVIVNYLDAGGVANAGTGVSMATLRDANNYRFAKPAHPSARWLATSIVVDPGTTTGEQVVAVVFNGGRGIRGGRYTFQALSVDPSNLTGVQDVAGNALDGEYYGYFASGNNVNGGDFSAHLDAIHHTIFPAQSQVGTATPVTPPGRPAHGWRIRNDGSLIPRPTSAVRLAARQPLTAARAARLVR